MGRPRIRSLKPDIWQHEKIGRLSRDVRLLFVGLITMADDQGRLRDRPRAILGHVFPYDEVTAQRLAKWMQALERVGLIRRYTVDEERYVAITGWSKHQRINRATDSELPPPPAMAVAPGQLAIANSVNAHGGLTEASVPDRKGRDRRGIRQVSGGPDLSAGASPPPGRESGSLDDEGTRALRAIG